MISQVDICNLALSHIGVENITAMEEGSEAARKCTLFYPHALSAILRSHDWTFAGVTEALALLSDETEIGYAYLYKYPANCLFIRKIFNESTDFTQKNTEEYAQGLSPTTLQKSIATNVEGAYIRYTVNVTDPTLYDPLFIEALSYKLAGLVAKPLTGDVSLGKSMLQIAEIKIEEAKLLNKREFKETVKRVSTTLNSRG